MIYLRVTEEISMHCPFMGNPTCRISNRNNLRRSGLCRMPRLTVVSPADNVRS